ncbi:MAG: SCP2 sterol-binding domain-containing protein [Actinomycetota bacterium]|nr:SCP2 sterol-binding domain-containing protein [Actinomycetota bacterium]
MIVEFVVAVGKKEQGRFFAQVNEGAVIASGAGAGPVEADVAFTMSPADADAVRAGTLDLSVGFMRGQIKMAGDFGALLHVLPLTRGSDAAVKPAAVLG